VQVLRRSELPAAPHLPEVPLPPIREGDSGGRGQDPDLHSHQGRTLAVRGADAVAVGIVELDGGVRILTQIADCEFDKLAIGQRVRLEFRRIQQDGEAGILCYGHKAVPA